MISNKCGWEEVVGEDGGTEVRQRARLRANTKGGVLDTSFEMLLGFQADSLVDSWKPVFKVWDRG